MAATSAKAGALRVAKRLDEVGFSDIVVIRNKVMELRAAGQTVHAFHGGEPFFETRTSCVFGLSTWYGISSVPSRLLFISHAAMKR